MTVTPTIAGVGDSTYALRSGRTVVSHISEAVGEALADAGLEHTDVDGLVVAGGTDYDLLATALGLETRWTHQSWNHGRFTAPIIQMASAAVRAGDARHVLCVHGRSGVTAFGGPAEKEAKREGGGPHGEVTHYGITAPASGAAMAWQRYAEVYGADRDALRHVTVNQRRNAGRNPNAVLGRKPLTEETYLRDPWIIEPLRRSDFALPNDGAVAVVVNDGSTGGVGILGSQGMRAGRSEVPFGRPGLGIGYQEDLDPPPEDHPVFARAGIGRGDVDVVGIYDSFAPQIVFDLERFGYCERGTAWEWIADGRIAFDGELPVNTSGGHLAESGQGGWNHVVELTRQLRGTAGARQVQGARVAQFIGPMGASIVLGA